jgi:hypothetical protein
MSNQPSISWGRLISAGILFFLLLFGFLWLFWLRFIPAENARIYNDPISGIRSIQICPGGVFPLVSNNVIVTDTASIREIMTAIRSAQPYFANHPATRWGCVLVISNSSGAGRLYILNTLGQGTIFGGHLRNDKLGSILEKVIGQKAANDK